MAKERKAYLDIMKFLAISLVVLGHCMQKYIFNYTNNVLYNFIWLFQMPAFFFISGYLHVKADKLTNIKDVWKFIFKRIRTYFIPIFTFIIFSSVINGEYTSFHSLLSIISNKIIQWPSNIHVSLWFLFALVVYSVYSIFITYIIGKQNNKFVKMLSAVCLILLFEGIFSVLMFAINGEFLGAKLIIYYSIYFIFGYIIEIIENNVRFKYKRNTEIILCASTGIITLFICFFANDIANFSDTNILQLMIRVLESFSAVYFVFLLLKLLLDGKKESIVSKLGQYTLEIYYIHVILIALITLGGAAPNYYEKPSSQWGAVLLSFLIIFVSSYIINFIIQYIPYLHYIVFGTKENKLNFKERKI